MVSTAACRRFVGFSSSRSTTLSSTATFSSFRNPIRSWNTETACPMVSISFILVSTNRSFSVLTSSRVCICATTSFSFVLLFSSASTLTFGKLPIAKITNAVATALLQGFMFIPPSFSYDFFIVRLFCKENMKRIKHFVAKN